MYDTVYADEPCVAVLHGALPSLKDVVYRNRVAIGVAEVVDVRRPRLTVIAAIDNLVKGAAGEGGLNNNTMVRRPPTAGGPLRNRPVSGTAGNETAGPPWGPSG